MSKADVLQSFIARIDTVADRETPHRLSSFFVEIGSYIGAAFGKDMYDLYHDLIQIIAGGEGFNLEEAIPIIKSFLLGLIEKEEISRDSRQENKSGVFDASNRKSVSSSVFLVHGHDNGAKEMTARFIEKLGLKAIILHEQTNDGKTVIEKFESFAEDVSFAVILLTPDDVGFTKSKMDQQNFRARQNVVLELGFFIGKLGRKHVCALVKGKVELPSDYNGVLYVPIDIEGMWKIKLAKEMKSAGLKVDLNQVV